MKPLFLVCWQWSYFSCGFGMEFLGFCGSWPNLEVFLMMFSWSFDECNLLLKIEFNGWIDIGFGLL
jgi:hypothetical protein